MRDVIKAIFDFAALKGHKVANPAEGIAPKSIASFNPRDRALSPLEIQILHKAMERIQATADDRFRCEFSHGRNEAYPTREGAIGKLSVLIEALIPV